MRGTCAGSCRRLRRSSTSAAWTSPKRRAATTRCAPPQPTPPLSRQRARRPLPPPCHRPLHCAGDRCAASHLTLPESSCVPALAPVVHLLTWPLPTDCYSEPRVRRRPDPRAALRRGHQAVRRPDPPAPGAAAHHQGRLARARSCIPMATPVHAHEPCPQPAQRDRYSPDWGGMRFGDDWCRQPHQLGAVRDSSVSPPHPLPASRIRCSQEGHEGRLRQQALFTELRKLLDTKLRITKHTLQVSWAHVGMAVVTSLPCRARRCVAATLARLHCDVACFSRGPPAGRHGRRRHPSSRRQFDAARLRRHGHPAHGALSAHPSSLWPCRLHMAPPISHSACPIGVCWWFACSGGVRGPHARVCAALVF